MIRKITVTAFLSLLILFPEVSFSETEQSSSVRKCEKILTDLRSLMDDKNAGGNIKVLAVVDRSFAELRNNKLEIHIDDSIPKDIYGGAQFQFSDNKSSIPAILISPYMITLYETRPSIVLSALVHEMQHAKSYFDDTDYFTAMRISDLEKYLYELDAYNIEANFIISYLQEDKFNLTNYEIFLSKSFTEDYLENFSFGLLGHDMRLTFFLYGIEKKSVSYEEKIAKVKKCLTELLDRDFQETGDAWENYQQTVPVYTALKFSPQIIRNIESNHGKIKNQNSYKMSDENKELYEILLKLEKKFVPLKKHYLDFLSEAQNQFKTHDSSLNLTSLRNRMILPNDRMAL